MTSADAPEEPRRPARPQYGEYAEPGDPRFMPPPAPTPPPTLAAAVAGAAPRSRDAVASALLLALGFGVTVYTVLSALGLEEALEQLYLLYGGTGDYEPTGGVRIAAWVIIASHVILYAATALLTRARLKAGRRSFWVPLVGGAVAAVIFFVTIVVVIVTDAPLVAAAMEFASSGTGLAP